jgi:hypothetical protein
MLQASVARMVVIAIGCYFECQRTLSAGPGTLVSFFDIARLLLRSLKARQVVIARLLLLRKSADTVRLKIIVSSLNFLNISPSPPPLSPQGRGENNKSQIFNAQTLDVLDIARKVIQSNGRAEVVYAAFFPTSNSCARGVPNSERPGGVLLSCLRNSQYDVLRPRADQVCHFDQREKSNL